MGSHHGSTRKSFIGVISDTHGLLRPEALAALAGCEQIIHAGDVGKAEILTELQRVAPLTTVRGNVDHGPWAEALPVQARLEVGGTQILVLHDLHTLDFDPAAVGIGVVISGHSHQPSVERKNGVLYLNPGSAGKRRFSLPVTLAKLEQGPDGPEAKLVRLLE